MKKKTFFTTMLLFLLFFNGAFLFLAVVFWHEKLDVQKEMALSEHYMILTSAARDMQALDSRGNGGNYNMEELMQPYTCLLYTSWKLWKAACTKRLPR